MDTESNTSYSSRFSFATLQERLRNLPEWARLNKKKIGIAAGIVFLVFIGNVLYSMVTSSRTLTVTGTSTTEAVTKSAVIAFSVTHEAPTQAQAVSEGQTRFTTVVDSLKNFPDANISHTTYRIVQTPKAAVSGNRIAQTPSFQYINAGRVETTDLGTVDTIVQQLYQSGSKTVTQVRYVPENIDEVSSTVRKEAIADARKKATELAKSSDSGIGRIISIQDTTNPESGSSLVTVNQENGPPTGGQNITIESSVVVVFQLRPLFLGVF